jgi:hypothetical protein
MTEHPIPAMNELREHLREAARRDVAARAPKRRRRRITFGVIALLLGGAAAAGAADLISTGDPVESPYRQADRYNPSGELQIAVTAPDGALPWGVAVYDSKDGQRCALVGRVRGRQIGELRDNRFHPYERNHSAACDDARHSVLDTARPPGRTLVYGRAKSGDKRADIVVDGAPKSAPTGAGGAFLFVFKGKASVSEFSTR